MVKLRGYFRKDTRLAKLNDVANIIKYAETLSRDFPRAVDETWNMEHPGTFRNIPEHPGTWNNYDHYEKKCANLNFGLARVTI